MSTIPKLEELQETARAAIAAAVLFAPLAAAIVIADDGTKEGSIETALRTQGFAVVIEPVLRGNLRTQADQAWIVDAEIMVKILVNPEVNNLGTGAQINTYAAMVAVIDALCRNPRHAGGERFRLEGEAFALSSFDSGLWAYDLHFTKEILL